MARDEFDALMAFMLAEHKGRGLNEPVPPVITIARDHGAGAEEIAAKVAQALGIRCFDREILDGVLAKAESDPGIMRTLDEKLPHRSGMFLYTSLMGLTDPLPEYLLLLTRMVNSIAEQGGVIVGRGAHLLLRGALRFRVRIIGSEEVCARRLAGDDDPGRIAAALSEVQSVNAARAHFFQETFKVSNSDPLQYDLVINTDRFTDLGAVAALIVQAYIAHIG